MGDLARTGLLRGRGDLGRGSATLEPAVTTSIFDIPVQTLSGQETTLRDFEGRVLVIVNTASECGFTPQFAGLEELYKKYESRGVSILGFPCNQFGGQEPGTSDQIQAFCQKNYGVTFPMFAKIEVNGDGAHPLYRHLKSEAKGILGTEAIKWNFTKFLIDRQGNVVSRHAPKDTPASLASAIEALL